MVHTTMERTYTTGTADSVTYFIGDEIEVTPAFNLRTLFVVGVMAPEEITDIATQHECNHVYFGANQSFDGQNINGWVRQIEHVLRLGFWATLDFDVKYANCSSNHTPPAWFVQLNTFEHFIPMISVKIPNLTMYNENATIKIDDVGFNATNSGVWCHQLNKLMDPEKLTEWSEYANDEIIEEGTDE